MLGQPDYGHYYKFLVWLGLGLLLVGLSLPWLVSRDDATLLLSRDEIEQLSENSRSVVESEQESRKWMQRGYPYASLALGLAGAVMVWNGTREWKRRQPVLNEVEDLDVAERRSRVTQANPADVEDERVEEALEQAIQDTVADRSPATGADEVSPRPSPIPAPSAPTFSSVGMRADAIRATAAEAESSVMQLASQTFSETHDAVSKAQLMGIGRSIAVDTLLLSRQPDQPSYLLEIKYVSSPKNMYNRIVDGVARCQRLARGAARTPEFGPAVAVLVLVLGDDVGGAHAARALDVVAEIDPDLRVALLTLDDLRNGRVSAPAFRRLMLTAPGSSPQS